MAQNPALLSALDDLRFVVDRLGEMLRSEGCFYPATALCSLGLLSWTKVKDTWRFQVDETNWEELPSWKKIQLATEFSLIIDAARAAKDEQEAIVCAAIGNLKTRYGV